MQKNRIRYLDIYKGLGIVLVVLGHMEATPYFWKLLLNAFHMPLFFVAAGLLTGEGTPRPPASPRKRRQIGRAHV